MVDFGMKVLRDPCIEANPYDGGVATLRPRAPPLSAMHARDISGVDLNLLKIFEALFEEGGASRAAIRLDMTQSAVSAALKRLRVLYDDRLFTPTGRGLAPTARARELKPVVTEALDRVRQSLAIASPQPASFRGRAVAIGLSDDFELALGQPIIAQVARHAPGLRVIFRQTYSQIVSDSLATQEIDLAIAAGGFGARGLSHQSLGQGDYACLVDAASLPPANDATLALEAFVARGHILVSSGGVVGIDHAFCRPAASAQGHPGRRHHSAPCRSGHCRTHRAAAGRMPARPARLSDRTGLARQCAARRGRGARARCHRRLRVLSGRTARLKKFRRTATDFSCCPVQE
jgi:DNA-binding transcriptional LysR family regulator